MGILNAVTQQDNISGVEAACRASRAIGVDAPRGARGGVVRAAAERSADARAQLAAGGGVAQGASVCGNRVANTADAAGRKPCLPDARVALALGFASCLALLFVDTWAGVALFAAGSLVALAMSPAWRRGVGTALAPVAFILACTVVAQLGSNPAAGLFYAARIAVMTLIAFTVAFSFDSAAFVRAACLMGAPLRKLRVPVDDIATMFSIALRFVPVMLEELQRVRRAQHSRGAQVRGGLAARVQTGGQALVPLFVGLFRRADMLGQAMDARAFGGAPQRTSLHGNERISAVQRTLCIALCAACILVAVFL